MHHYHQFISVEVFLENSRENKQPNKDPFLEKKPLQLFNFVFLDFLMQWNLADIAKGQGTGTGKICRSL